MTSSEIAHALNNRYKRYGNIGSYINRKLFIGGDMKGNLPKNTETLYKTFRGIEFKLTPFVPNKRNQRGFVLCECGKWIPIGRMNQHLCKRVR